MRRRVTAGFTGLVFAMFAAGCSNAPTSNLEPHVLPTPVQTATASPSATATATPAPSPTVTAAASPTATPIGPTPTPGPITFVPSSVVAENSISPPYSEKQPAICPSASATNTSCFGGDPTEIDPSESGYSGAFSPVSSSASIAQADACGTTSTTCNASNGILVYPQSPGSTSVVVSDTNGHNATLPVSVAETNLNITLSNLPSADQICVSYQTIGGATGEVVSFQTITNPSSNPTVQFVNVPIPVNVQLEMLRAVVNPPNEGMSGCANGLAQNTLSFITLAPGQVNTEAFTVSATSQ